MIKLSAATQTSPWFKGGETFLHDFDEGDSTVSSDSSDVRELLPQESNSLVT